MILATVAEERSSEVLLRNILGVSCDLRMLPSRALTITQIWPSSSYNHAYQDVVQKTTQGRGLFKHPHGGPIHLYRVYWFHNMEAASSDEQKGTSVALAEAEESCKF